MCINIVIMYLLLALSIILMMKVPQRITFDPAIHHPAYFPGTFKF